MSAWQDRLRKLLNDSAVYFGLAEAPAAPVPAAADPGELAALRAEVRELREEVERLRLEVRLTRG